MSTPEPGAGGQRGAQPVANPHDKRRPWWLWLILAVVALAILLLLLSRCGASDDAATGRVASATSAGAAAATSTDAGGAAATTDPGAASSTPAPNAATTSAESSAAAPTTGAAPAAAAVGSLSSDGTALLPLTSSAPDGTLTAYAGQPATANAVTVQSVPADEGFWVGPSATDRVWVQLTGAGESPYTVRPGDTVSFTAGQVVANPAGYPATAGLGAADGAAQLTSQAAHVEVAKDALQLTKG